jgi:hypothetical protein
MRKDTYCVANGERVGRFVTTLERMSVHPPPCPTNLGQQKTGWRNSMPQQLGLYSRILAKPGPCAIVRAQHTNLLRKTQ